MDQNKFVYITSDTNSTQIIEVKENIVETLKNSSYGNKNLWVRTNNFCIPIELDFNSFLQYPEIVHSEKIKIFDMAFPSIQLFHELNHDTKIIYVNLKSLNQSDFDIKISIDIEPKEENLNISYLIKKICEQFAILITIKEISLDDNKFDDNTTIKNLFEQKSNNNFIALCEFSDDSITDLINSRNNILNQINEEEKSYVSCLDKLINFWEPKVADLEIFLDEEEDPFQRIEQLFKLHKNLSSALDSHLKGFKTEYSPIFYYYSHLFPNSLKYLLHTSDFILSVQNSLIFDETSEKLNELSSQCNNISFIDYLKKPKEHYESYIANLLKLQQSTPNWHPDNIFIPFAIKEISSVVNQFKKKEYENSSADEENDVKILIDDQDDSREDEFMKMLNDEVSNFDGSSPASQKKQIDDLDNVIESLDNSNTTKRGRYFSSPPGRRPSLKKMLDFEDEENTTPPSLKKMLDFGDPQNVEKLMSLINSSDDEESILTKIDEVCSPRNKGRRLIDIDLNTIDPQPDVKDKYPKKRRSEMDKIEFSKSDINFLNGQVKPETNQNGNQNPNEKSDDKEIRKSNNSLVEQTDELLKFSKTKYVKHPEITDEIPVGLNDLKPQPFRTNRPFNYRNFFNNNKDDSYDHENSDSENGKVELSPNEDYIYEKYFGQPYSEVYLHLNHTRVIPKENPDEKRSIFASPRKRNTSLGYYTYNNGLYSPEEQEKRIRKFASELDQEDNVKYINQAERKRINSPKTEQRKPFRVGLFKSNNKTVQVKKRHKSNIDIRPRRYNLNPNNSTKASYKNKFPISKLNQNSNKSNRERRLDSSANKVDDDVDDDDAKIIKNINFESPEKEETVEYPIIEEDEDDIDLNFDDDDNNNNNNNDISSEIPDILSFPFQIDSPITIDSPIKTDGAIKIDSPMKFKK